MKPPHKSGAVVGPPDLGSTQVSSSAAPRHRVRTPKRTRSDKRASELPTLVVQAQERLSERDYQGVVELLPGLDISSDPRREVNSPYPGLKGTAYALLRRGLRRVGRLRRSNHRTTAGGPPLRRGWERLGPAQLVDYAVALLGVQRPADAVWRLPARKRHGFLPPTPCSPRLRPGTGR